MGLGDDIGQILPWGGGGANAGGAIDILFQVAPIVLSIVLVAVSAFVAIWFLRFKYIVYIYSLRANGQQIVQKTRGGFFVNFRTKTQYFRLLNNMKIGIPAPPSWAIKKDGRKDIVYLYRSAHDEYIPVSYKETVNIAGEKNGKRCVKCGNKFIWDFKKELTCPSEYCDNIKDFDDVVIIKPMKELVVHRQLLKGWYGNMVASSRDKYAVAGWLERNQALIISITAGMIFFFCFMYSAKMIESASKLCSRSPSVSMLALIPYRWIKGGLKDLQRR